MEGDKRMKEMLLAVCVLRGNDLAPCLRGMVRFCDTSCGVCVDAKVSGLPPNATGFYGFHIHEGTRCSPYDFSDAGGHYNPGDTAHPLHAGDMPMIMAGASGTGRLCFVTPRFAVRDVIGRAVIVHGDRDDYTSQPSGNAGARIGCGIIRRV